MDKAANRKVSLGIAALFNTKRPSDNSGSQTPKNAMDLDQPNARVQFKNPIVEPSPVPRHRPFTARSPSLEVSDIRPMSPRHFSRSQSNARAPMLPSSSPIDIAPHRPIQVRRNTSGQSQKCHSTWKTWKRTATRMWR